MKRKICLLLAMLMILSAMTIFASCSKDNGDGAATTVTTIPQNNNGGQGGDDDAKLFEDLPEGSYDGYVFTFLNGTSNYAITTIVPEATTDTVDAALFARNSYVKEKLKVEIVESLQNYDVVKSTMASLTSSNDFEYDAVYNSVYLQTALAQSGTYLSTDDVDKYLNFNKPWWFKDVMDSIAIDDKGFEIYGDLQLMYYDSIWGMAFNQQDFIDNKQTFPYELVRSGEWTLAEMEKIMKATYQKPGSDHYAIVGHKDLISAMMVAADFELVSQDDEDILKVFEDEEYFVNVYTAIMNTFFTSNGPDKMNMIIADYASAAYKSGIFQQLKDDGFQKWFIQGKGTFMGGTIGDLRQVRASEFSYGIVPLPKIDEDQEQYVSMVVSYAASLGIPAATPNLERACTILENMAAYSYKLVRYEYYDVVVQGRTVRDNDSIEMLDIIFGHTELGKTKLEIDMLYSIGIMDVIRKDMSDAVSTIMVSIDGAMGTIEGNMESVIEGYK